MAISPKKGEGICQAIPFEIQSIQRPIKIKICGRRTNDYEAPNKMKIELHLIIIEYKNEIHLNTHATITSDDAPQGVSHNMDGNTNRL
jgi:hypothetical protein